MTKLVFVAVATLCALSAFADEVSGDDAMTAVAGWVNVKAALGEDFTAQPTNVREYQAKDGNGKFYVVELEGGGFVVTSGDTGLEPVIAYSKEGTWVDDVKRNPLLAMLPIDVSLAVLAEQSSASSSSVTSGVGRRLAAAASGDKASKWAELMAAATPTKGGKTRLQAGSRTSVNDVRVDKLLTTQWGQGDPNYTRVAFNYYTPTKASNGSYRFYSGCVATAGGQIMYYHKWPQSSITLLKNYTHTFENNRIFTAEDGYQTSQNSAYVKWDNVPFGGTYNWNNMAATVTTSRWGTVSTSYSTAAKQAIGKLLRDIGISVYMNYSSDGSGAQYSCLYMRLTDQFGYANAALKNKPSEDEWRRGILANLDAKLPVGVSVPGHAIVADGYGYQSGTLYIHFNMGWEGSKDFWYNPPDLTDSGFSDFTAIDTIVYNIYPEGTPNCTIVSGRIKNASGALMSGAAVTAVNRASGARISATTDAKGIYALRVPAGEYLVGTGNGSGYVVSTNLTVEACESTQLVRDTMEQEASGSYYPGGKVADIHGVELQLAAYAAPVITPADGTTFRGAKQGVSISCADASAEIRYTTDGSEPTTSSTLYEGPFTITATTTVKARAFAGGVWGGALASATFTKIPYYGDGGLYPDTPRNRARHWIDEREVTQEATGTWSNEVAYVNGKAAISGENRFEPHEQSPARKRVTLKVKLTAKNAIDAYDGADYPNAKAAVRIGRNRRFQVYTSADGVRAWRDASGATPAAGVEYDVTLTLDFRTQTYTVSLQADGGAETPLICAGSAAIPFASAGTQVRGVLLDGRSELISIDGSYKANAGFAIITR